MNFANVKSITMPEGKVKKITVGGVVLWEEAASEIFETVIPHIAPRSTWFDGLVSNGVLTLIPSNTEGALGVSTPNSYAYTDRNSKTFYLMPIDGKYNKATLNYSATDGLAVKYYLQAIKDNGGKFTAVATVGKGSNNVIEWAKNSADYLLISIEHSDGTSRWDWNSAGKTISVTFSGPAKQYTNLFVPSAATLNSRINSSNVVVTDANAQGKMITNFIDVSGKTPFTSSTKVYIKGATFTADGNTRVLSYKKETTTDYASPYSKLNGGAVAVTDEGNGVISFTGASSNIASSFADGVKQMVLVLKVKDTAITYDDIKNIVVTIDEPIN